MQLPNKMSNLQLELLKIFSFEINEDQLLEIKSMLTTYFADKVTKDVDRLFEDQNWGAEKIEEWSNEYMRIKT